MRIFHDIKNSVYGPEFYKQIRSASGGRAMGFFSKITLIQTFITVVVLSVLTFIVISSFYSKIGIDKVVSYFPSELTVTTTAGQISTNVTEPYIIPLPADLASDDSNMTRRTQNLLVIDTKAVPSADEFTKYDTQLLITKEYLITKKSSSEISIQKITGIPDMVIDQSKWSLLVHKAASWLRVGLPIVALIAFVFFFVIYFIGNLFFVLIFSFVAWIIQHVRKDKISYGQAYKVGLYAVTLPTLLGSLTGIFGWYMPWYLSAIIFLIIFFINHPVISSNSQKV